MATDQETITVAELSDGPPRGSQPARRVSLPVVEILTGRGFVTGKSGSGKSNTASVIAEKLLDNGFGLLIVDIDGEYYGLKEEYEILHVGADDECDIQVTTDHAGKIASLALEQNVPIILDVSSFLDEDEAASLLTEVAKQLFAKEKKLKQPFLLLVEEVHEYIPENGSVGECGKMLIKIGKRGRKHGLGMVGISQRPADVKKDFITQCDWLVWHRLTWNNDTKVVSRILDGQYADAVEGLGDGEAFLMTDWSESVRRVQFRRKQTFDAGATPGLEDVERPDLKSVSDDLVSELEAISEERQRTADRVQELRAELDEKNSRIAELEAELQDARDMSRMADQFVDALVDAVEGSNPGRTERERMRSSRAARTGSGRADDGDVATAGTGQDSQGEVSDAGAESAESDADPFEAVDTSLFADDTADDTECGSTAAAVGFETTSNGTSTGSRDADTNGADTRGGPDLPGVGGDADGGASDEKGYGAASSPQETSADDADVAAALSALDDGGSTRSDGAETWPGGVPSAYADLVEQLRSTLESMPTKTRGMLRYYRKEGPAKPLDAFFAAGGEGDRTNAYAHNRTLRTHGFVEHAGRGFYDYRLRDLLREEAEREPSDADLDALVESLESVVAP